MPTELWAMVGALGTAVAWVIKELTAGWLRRRDIETAGLAKEQELDAALETLSIQTLQAAIESIPSLEQRARANEDKAQELGRNLEQLTETIVTMQRTIDRRDNQLRELTGAYDRLKEDYTNALERLDTLANDYDRLKSSYEQLQSDYERLEQAYQDLKAQMLEVRHDNEALIKINDSLKTKNDRLEKALSACAIERNMYQKVMAQLGISVTGGVAYPAGKEPPTPPAPTNQKEETQDND